MMVFKAREARTFKVKFGIETRNDGKPRTFSTGATVKAVAEDVERMVNRMKGRRDWAALEAVFDGHLTLAAVYDADVRGALPALLAELRDADLDPLVTEWAKRANVKYVRQVRELVKEGERFPASRFRRKVVSEFLSGLPVADPTKNRYRAALSVFAKWLVEREVLETNPVRDVAMYRERDPRMIWMTWADAERVVKALPVEYRALIATMAATGLERGAALALLRSDVDLDAGTLHAKGSKTTWRNRVVRIEPWALPYLRDHLKSILSGLAFPEFQLPTIDIAYAATTNAFKAAQKAVGLSGHRFHDLRHTYAVNALRKGYRPQVVAHQLGHRDATMVHKVYGRFVPDASDYTATKMATTTSRKARGHRG